MEIVMEYLDTQQIHVERNVTEVMVIETVDGGIDGWGRVVQERFELAQGFDDANID